MKDVLISQMPLLASLPADELERLSATLTVRVFPAGTVLFREGEPGTVLYSIVEGQAQIVKALGTDDERVIGVCGPGDFVGEMSLLSPDAHRTASVRSAGELRALELPLAELSAVLKRYPEVGYQLVATLSRRLDATNVATIHDLHEKNVELSASHGQLSQAYSQLKRTRHFAIALLVVLLLIAAAVAGLLAYYQFAVRTALETPSDLLLTMAQVGRTLNVPAEADALKNPIPLTSDGVVIARRTYTGHCNTCHGPDGKGDTPVGTHTFPRASDLTAAQTQGRPDGALHWLIENGSPRTGMPGWKGTLDEEEIWQLVSYMRLLAEGQQAIVKRLPTPMPRPSAPPAPPTPTAAPGATPVQAARTFTVTIDDYQFVPAELVVPVGSTVVWENKEGDSHNIISLSKPPFLESPLLYFRGTYAVVFNTPGTYTYACTFHDFMHGTVVVQ
ncbi:MAG: cyclic nucleotide-binding domain-containing protein [Chloroflexi bacterium]|nr:cyclic nucleotide-binding domain-containing protein [Chloroflexota bacterium]